MHTIRTALSAAASVLAAAALSATIGLVAMPAHAAPAPVWHPSSPASTAPSTVPDWTPVTRTEAYAAYLAGYGNDGCRADFDATYLGTMPITSLEQAAQDEIAWQIREYPDQPAFIDYADGSGDASAIQIPARPTEVALIGEYTGACA